jgi:hypothetical protein
MEKCCQFFSVPIHKLIAVACNMKKFPQMFLIKEYLQKTVRIVNETVL